MHRIKSLSNHDKIISIPRGDRQAPTEDDYDDREPTHFVRVGAARVPKYMMEL